MPSDEFMKARLVNADDVTYPLKPSETGVRVDLPTLSDADVERIADRVAEKVVLAIDYRELTAQFRKGHL